MRRAAAFRGVPRAGALHEDLSHRQRGDGQEVRLVGELARPFGGESNVGFVDERRGLQRLAWALAADVSRRDAAQLVIDERHQVRVLHRQLPIPNAQLPKSTLNGPRLLGVGSWELGVVTSSRP